VSNIKYKIITTGAAIIIGTLLTVTMSTILNNINKSPKEPSLIGRMVEAMESLARSEREQTKRRS